MATEAEYRRDVAQVESEVASGTRTPESAKRMLDSMRSGLIGGSDPLSPLAKASLIEEIQDKINVLSGPPGAEATPVSNLRYGQLIEELRRLRVDPTKGKYSSGTEEGRRADLLNDFMSRLDEWKEAGSRDESLRLLALKVQYLLERMVATKDNGSGAVSVPRKELMEVLPSYLMSREDILLATTYHPDWGDDVRQILDSMVHDASTNAFTLRSGEKFAYSTLSSSRGGYFLDKYVSEVHAGRNPQAQEFAKLLFHGFDMLSIVLQTQQRLAEGTRSHNGGEDIEPIAAQDMLASYIQNRDRYGGNSADWRGWCTPWVTEIPDGGMYGPSGNPEGVKQMRDLVLAYYDCFIDVDRLVTPLQVAPKLDSESYFPDTRDIFKLGITPRVSGGRRLPEKLTYPQEVGGPVETIDAFGGMSANRSDPPASWNEYQTAYSGWMQMLTISYQDVGDHLTESQILQEAGAGKGGLLNKFLSEAGKAKIFQPKHLHDFLPVMLFLFIVKLIQFSNTDKSEKPALRDKIIYALRQSGGLMSGFSHEIETVIGKLEDPTVVGAGWRTRRRQVNHYIDLYCNVYKIQNPGTVGSADQLTEHQREIRAVLNAKQGPIAPLRRDGSMLTTEKH